ncbi:MAG: haloacid dehalogenase-like hydrolase [Cyclobacteriaceae bacterium]|nr:haloacid dehalogenase-like hydrolase [Cyclobacteriaceae bacterium]
MLAFSCAPEKKPETIIEVADPLPSWHEGSTKTSIINYVESVSKDGSDNFINAKDRIAVFDNDGTLWSEKPMYFQLFFAIDQVKALAPEHPEWKNTEPFKSILNDDLQAVMSSGMEGLVQIVMASHAGMSSEDFEQSVKDWAVTAVHPTKSRPFTALVYQPMLELLHYLRDHGFRTYIVSGGGVDFMRALVTEVYGIPEEQIIGSTVKTGFDYNNGQPMIMRYPAIDFIDDKEGKPVNIHKIIGKKPVFCAGNSDGDLAMMQWTASNSLQSFKLFVHHTDSVREWAYDRDSHIGKLDQGLDQAIRDRWTLADMQKDWKVIYPFELEN